MQRRNLCELMISLTVGVDDRAVIAFYEKNIEYILATVQREIASSSKQLQDWVEKTDCLRLLQISFLYHIMTPNELLLTLTNIIFNLCHTTFLIDYLWIFSLQTMLFMKNG